MLTVMQLLDYSNALNYCVIEKIKTLDFNIRNEPPTSYRKPKINLDKRLLCSTVLRVADKKSICNKNHQS